MTLPGATLTRFYIFCSIELILAQNPVVQRFTDRRCQNLDSDEKSEGIQQSWMPPPTSASYCYEVTVGLGCALGQCAIKLTCDYATGSGIVLEEYADSACASAVIRTSPMALHLTWLEALSFLSGESCTQFGSKYFKFAGEDIGGVGGIPYIPDCSAQGAVDASDLGTSASYEETYYMTLYSDPLCEYVYEIPEYGVVQSNRWSFKVHRGVQHCLDYNDATDRGDNSSSTVINQDINNFQFVCGNLDGLGNGVMIRRYSGQACSGSVGDSEYWRDVWEPINVADLRKLLNAECVNIGSSEAYKMDKPWLPAHYPNCETYACSTGYCSGGSPEKRYTGAGPYYGDIRTPVTQAQGDTTSRSQKEAVRSLLALSILSLWL